MSLGEKFFELFKGLHRAHGTSKITGKNEKSNKVKADYKMVRSGPTVELWEKHLAGEYSIGVVPIMEDATCVFGAIDIDVYPLDIAEISEKIKELNLPLIPCATKSGGVHAYLFLKEPLLAKDVRDHLYEWSSELGYPGVEVFPKQRNLSGPTDNGNFINMPYFGDTKKAFVDGDFIDKETFLTLADKLKVSLEELREIEFQEDEDFKGGPPCLQHLVKEGFPEGSRNNALFDLGVYAKMRYGEFDFEAKVEEYNIAYMSPGSSKEVQNIIRGLNKKSYFYKCNEPPLSTNCNKQLCRTRKYGIGNSSGASPALVSIDSLEKITSHPPVWIVNIDGFRVQMDTSQLREQGKFQLVCMENINKIPPKMKDLDWQQLLNDLMDPENCTFLEPPEDVSPAGQVMLYLEQFCTGGARQTAREDLLRGLPWIDEDSNLTYFRSNDFKKFLDSNSYRELTMPKLYALLRDKGVRHHKSGFHIKGKCVTVWSIPTFDEQNEDFEEKRPNEKGEF